MPARGGTSLRRGSSPQPDQGRLPPRLRRTLGHLLRGESEKEIARTLGLSQHTVHEYVKDLYAELNVSSRGELLAQWIGKV